LSEKSKPGWEHGFREEGSPDSSEFVGFWPNFSDFVGFRRDFAGITVEDSLGTKKLVLRAFWKKVPTLKDFETLVGYIMNF
jgi:hypothetical protein